MTPTRNVSLRSGWLCTGMPYDRFFQTEEVTRPARTTVVADFAVQGMLVEVEVTAGIPS